MQRRVAALVGGVEVGSETSISKGETITFSIPWGTTEFELEALGGDGIYFCRLLVGDNGVSTSDGGAAVTYLIMDDPCDSGANYHDATCYDQVTLYILSSPPPLTFASFPPFSPSKSSSKSPSGALLDSVFDAFPPSIFISWPTILVA